LIQTLLLCGDYSSYLNVAPIKTFSKNTRVSVSGRERRKHAEEPAGPNVKTSKEIDKISEQWQATGYYMGQESVKSKI